MEFASVSAEDDIQTSASAMPRMCTSHRGNPHGVTGCGEPVADRRPNAPALDRWIAGAGVAGDEQHHPLIRRNRLLQAAVYRAPGTVEIVAVQIDDPIR